MFQLRRAALLIITIVVVNACTHPIEIYGEGDVLSASGNRDCTLELFQANDPKCTKNLVVGAYSEQYTAVPRPGWAFKQWRTYCEELTLASQPCVFNQPPFRVIQHWGETMWPLRAEFVEVCTGCLEQIAPVLGAVTDTSVKIWRATSDDAIFKVLYREVGMGTWIEETVVVNAASGYAGTIELTGLSPDTLYEYETFLNDLYPYNATFSTLPIAAGFTGQTTFGMGTDLIHYEQPFTALGHAAAKNYDFMLLIGDLTYVDPPGRPIIPNDAASYRARYWNNWNDVHFSALSSTTPMFMMWDDHEIVNDYYPNIPGTNRYPAARSAFDDYVATHNPAPATSGELYYSFSVPGADFFVLDTRTFRDPESDPDDINKSMLGDVQRNALLDYLEFTSTAPFKFIVTSVPFSLGEASQDTWSNYQAEREIILGELESRGISNVVFLSGDRHWSGAFRIISPGGYVYYDFLPSPTGAGVREVPAAISHPGQEEISWTSGEYQIFGDFQIDLSGATPQLRVAFVDSTGVEQCVITIGNNESGVMAAGAPPLATCAP